VGSTATKRHCERNLKKKEKERNEIKEKRNKEREIIEMEKNVIN